MLRIVIDVAVRVAVFVGIYLVFAHLVSLPDDDGLGTGLLALTTFVLVALAWAGFDGWRAAVLRVVVLWSAVAVLSAFVIELLIQADSDDMSVSVVDALGELWFFTVMIAAPALFAGVLTALVTPRRTTPAAHG